MSNLWKIDAMSTRASDAMARTREELRYEPTEKRIRALLGDETVVDSVRALLVWEPRRVVPAYAVPAEDVRGELVPAPPAPPGPNRPVLHPGIPFAEHSTPGEPASVRAGGQTREGAAFRLADADLKEYVVLDTRAFDAWYEEDEPVRSHPRDPFHRVDVRQSSRHVRIELGGQVLAESTRPRLLFETNLPTRFYLPREDLTTQAQPSERQTYCPYKGEASYWSFEVDGRRRPDLAWSYAEPLPDAVAIAGLVAFFDER